MLRGIRKASSNWLGKTIMAVVMGVLIVSFGIWGIADIFRGFGQSTLAKIGRTEISTEQFRQIFTERLQQIGRQFGRPMTMDQARAFGLDRQVLQQIIAEAALDEDARQMGLGQSDAETMRMITSDPNFKGVSGEEARKIFDERKDKLATPERRQVSQIVFPSVEEAQAARSRIASGLSFEDLAKERGLNAADVDLGTVAKSGILDPAIAEAA